MQAFFICDQSQARIHEDVQQDRAHWQGTRSAAAGWLSMCNKRCRAELALRGRACCRLQVLLVVAFIQARVSSTLTALRCAPFVKLPPDLQQS